MADAHFYHLIRTPAEQLLPNLISRSADAGWRVEVRGTSRERMARINDMLWQGDGFLPHGLSGGPHDADQPVLLTVAGDGAAGANGAACLMTLDGAALDPAEGAALSRICIIFDGADTAAVERARDDWRRLTSAGVSAEYWSDAEGRWERKR